MILVPDGQELQERQLEAGLGMRPEDSWSSQTRLLLQQLYCLGAA